jgi:hypothetical protein
MANYKEVLMMSRFVGIALLVPAVLASQQTSTTDSGRVEIRSGDAQRVATATLSFEGALFHGIGVLRPAPGTVNCGPEGCRATTPAVMDISRSAGTVRITVPLDGPPIEVAFWPTKGSAVTAMGHTIYVERDAGGALRVRADSIRSRRGL